jgi:hypothetical protein
MDNLDVFASATSKPQKSLWLSGFIMVVIAWVLGLVWASVLVAVRATNIQMMDPLMLYLLMPVWLLCFGLVVVGSYRIASLIRSWGLRIVVMLAVVALQCCLYCVAMVFIAIYVHFWAGGTC